MHFQNFTKKVVATALAMAVQSLFAATGLTVLVSADRSRFSDGEPIPVTIQIKNVGTSTIVLPKLEETSRQTYLTISAKTPAGAPVVFFPKLRDRPPTGALSSVTEQLQPQQEIVLTEVLNDSGIGAFVSPQPGTLQQYVGELRIDATLSVNANQQPLQSDPGLFLGSVSSNDTQTPLSLALINKNTGDLDASGAVNCADIAIVRAAFGKKCSQPGFDARADVNKDCVVDIRDLASVAQKLSVTAQCQ